MDTPRLQAKNRMDDCSSNSFGSANCYHRRGTCCGFRWHACCCCTCLLLLPPPELLVLVSGDNMPFLLDPKWHFSLDKYANGVSISLPPVQATIAPVFNLAQQDLRQMEVLQAHASRIMAPCKKHYKDLLVDRVDQLERMKAARLFDPLHAKANTITHEQIDMLKVFRFAGHPLLAPAIEAMKNEVHRYMAMVNDIPPVEQRMVEKTLHNKKTVKKDSFDIAQWWQQHGIHLPSFALVLRAVLCHSTSSCATERVFSILNDTFTEDQRSARADYMELSLQLQYNSRGRA